MKKIENNNATIKILLLRNTIKKGWKKNLSRRVSFNRNSRWSPAFYEAGLLKNIDLKITNVASKSMEFFALFFHFIFRILFLLILNFFVKICFRVLRYYHDYLASVIN